MSHAVAVSDTGWRPYAARGTVTDLAMLLDLAELFNSGDTGVNRHGSRQSTRISLHLVSPRSRLAVYCNPCHIRGAGPRNLHDSHLLNRLTLASVGRVTPESPAPSHTSLSALHIWRGTHYLSKMLLGTSGAGQPFVLCWKVSPQECAPPGLLVVGPQPSCVSYKRSAPISTKTPQSGR